MRVTDDTGVGGGGGVTMEGISWNYPTPPYSLHNLHDQEDDDDDLYYVDSEPIDMEARLKEVNRALAEDITPLEGERSTKIRFCEVIASYQSPRDYYVSDSDDGYGDSSDTMYDIEDDIEALTPLDNKNISPVSISNPLENLSKTPSSILVTSSKKNSNSSINLENKENDQTKISWTDDSKNSERKNSFSKAKVGLNLDETDRQKPQENDIKIEDFQDINKVKSDSEVKDDFFKSSESGIFKAEGRDLFKKSENSDKKSNSVFKITKPSDYYGYDSDDFEDDEISEEIVTEISNKPKTNQKEKETENAQEIKRAMETKNESTNEVEEPKPTPAPNKELSDDKLFSPPVLKPFNKKERPSSALNMKTTSHDILEKSKPSVKSTDSYNKPERGRTSQRTSSTTPTIKPALMKTDNLLPLSDSRSRSSKLSSTRLVRQARPSTPAACRNPRVKSDQLSNTSSNSSTRSDRQTTKPLMSTTVQPTMHKNATFYDKTQRKTSPSPAIPSTAIRPSSARPVKALHSSSINKMIQNHARASSATKSKGLPSSSLSNCHKGVRKAASTTDLHRVDAQTERQKESEAVYKAWLKQKNQQAARNKKAQAAARTANATTSNGSSSSNVCDRRALAEQAFQSWLRRKREQLKLEKKMKSHKRRIDQQAHLARTRAECDNAYKEWCQRKREEVAATRAVGVATRSHSLERTSWHKEKTRQLYTAYLST